MKWLVIILTAMFTGAKLAKAISWSWWLVFSPVIAYYGIISILIALGWFGVFIYFIIDLLKRRMRHNASSKHKN